MPTSVVMPQMGESIAEGTIVRWIKKVGDQVDRDEPLFEISTDKVDAEVPSPAAGVLTDIAVKEGETVPVNSVVATIGQAGEETQTQAQPAPPQPQPDGTPAATAKAPPKKANGATGHAASGRPAGGSMAGDSMAGDSMAGDSAAGGPVTGGPVTGGSAAGGPSTGGPVTGGSAAGGPLTGRPVAGGLQASGTAPTRDDLRRKKSSPLVRRIARENDVDISRIPGSGVGGRVTKQDILGYLEGDTADAGPAARGQADRAPGAPSRGPDGDRVDVRPLSPMRRKIAEHMVLSRRTSAHVHSVFHVNFSEVERIRQEKKADYEQLGTRLTYMAFIAKAVIDAIRRQPIVNASLDGDNVLYRKDVNLGIAVALEEGLIVPVIKNADEKNMLGLSRAIADVAERARAKQLKPEEVHGGTFTITNPGQFGAQFGMPIINQPQVAILGVGTIEKRAVVVDDAIAIRTMAYLTLGYDHRLVDGAVADQFMSDVKQQLEAFDASQV